ncbi:MAG: prolyl oligopeptidase family serine peptidase [Rubripirellula sp.]|nr:prolyl oligopeptidase family serine peptidase [Rubripirellula sp.]
MKTNLFQLLFTQVLFLSQALVSNAQEDSVATSATTEFRSMPEVLSTYFETPESWIADYGNYRSPLQLDDGTTVTDQKSWDTRRQQLRQWWMQQLGQWPPLITKPELEILEIKNHESYIEQRVSFLWTPDEKTVGYLLIPKTPFQKPAVVTVFYEPETALGRGKPNRDFAIQLTKRGFVTLSIGTTEATTNKTYSIYYPSLQQAEVAPLSMLAYAAANAWHVLASHDEVDSKRIGIVGHSFGGKWAMFASCLWDQFACAAWSDPGIVFDETRPSVNYWEPWYLGYHQPPWRKRGMITEDNPAQGLYLSLRKESKDLHLLHALMAPRPVLVSGGSEDPPSRWQALNHLIQINDLLGYEHRVGMTNRPKHDPNPESNEIIYKFFEHFLMQKKITH